MTFLFLMLCALCEVFLLRFLLALVRENRSALRHRDYYRWQSKQTVTSGALLQMKSQTGGEQGSSMAEDPIYRKPNAG
jgi:hypothetical protein